MQKYIKIFFYYGGWIRGLKRCIDTFTQVDVFDIKRPGINTRENLRNGYSNNQYNFYAPVYSSVSEEMLYLSHDYWTSAIRYTDFNAETIFVDLGCGSGKTLMQAAEMRKFNHIIGVELLPVLIERAHQNIKRNNQNNKYKNINLINAQVENNQWIKELGSIINLSQKSTIFIFNKNSYGSDILNQSLEITETTFKNIIYLYQNPIHSDVLVKRGYEMFAYDSKQSTINKNFKYKLFIKKST